MNDPKKNKVSAWKGKAEFRLKNRKWLNYSSNIARRIAAVLEERKDLNQKNLAELLDVSQQYISKLLKGEENLTLETIAKLSTVLGVELIAFPEYKYSLPVEESAEILKSNLIINQTEIHKKIIVTIKPYYIEDTKKHIEFFSGEKFSPKEDISSNTFISSDQFHSEVLN